MGKSQAWNNHGACERGAFELGSSLQSDRNQFDILSWIPRTLAYQWSIKGISREPDILDMRLVVFMPT